MLCHRCTWLYDRRMWRGSSGGHDVAARHLYFLGHGESRPGNTSSGRYASSSRVGKCGVFPDVDAVAMALERYSRRHRRFDRGTRARANPRNGDGDRRGGSGSERQGRRGDRRQPVAPRGDLGRGRAASEIVTPSKSDAASSSSNGFTSNPPGHGWSAYHKTHSGTCRTAARRPMEHADRTRGSRLVRPTGRRLGSSQARPPPFGLSHAAMTRMRRWSGRPWVRRREPAAWTTGTVAVLATAVMFVVAFLAMTRTRVFQFSGSGRRDSLTVVHLEPPVRGEPPRSRATVPKHESRPARAPRTVSPQLPPARSPTDTGSGAAQNAPPATPSRIPIGIPRGEPGAPGGAPPGAPARGDATYGTAGVVAPRAPISPEAMDSIEARKRGTYEEWHRPLTPQELADVRARREPGLAPTARAARLPGEPVYAPLMNGGYAVAIPIVSIPLPFGGPSAKKRKADSIINADFQSRLARLQQRARLRRDSVLADSARRDSLSRIARRP